MGDSSDDITGWTQVAQIGDATNPAYEEADILSDELPDEYRAVEVLADGGGYLVERQTTYGSRWVQAAELIGDDAAYEWGEELNDAFGDDYRAVSVYYGGVVLEKRIGDDE